MDLAPDCEGSTPNAHPIGLGVWLTLAWMVTVIAFCLTSFGPVGGGHAFGMIVAGLIALWINRPILSLVMGPIILTGWVIFTAPGCISYRWQTERMACTDNLHAIGMALQRYQDKNGHFPPAFLVDEAGEPAHSWRVLILPYLDKREPINGRTGETYANVHARYRYDEPWNSPHNASLADLVDAYRCPSHHHDKSRPATATT